MNGKDMDWSRLIDGKDMDWPRLKENYRTWRFALFKKTLGTLSSSEMLELSQLNDIGYYHNVRSSKAFTKMRTEMNGTGAVPENWIYEKGEPGIWTALFDPCNTYSISSEPPHIMQFYFKDGFYLFDLDSSKHQELWASWQANGTSNPWSTLLNGGTSSLEERMKSQGFPDHKAFYKEHNFGATIGYSDYISAVVVLPEAVEKVVFLD